MKVLFTLISIIFFHGCLLAQTSVTVIMTGPGKDRITKADMFDAHQKQIVTNAYKDTLKYHFTQTPKVEHYWIRYFIGEEMYRQMIWLGDGQITIYAHLGKDELVLDSILNSTIHLDIAEYYKMLGQMPKDRINSFRLEQLKKFINTPFSFYIGNEFLVNNSMNKQNLNLLKQVFELQGDQFSTMPDYQSLVGQLDLILNLERIRLDNYVFIDRFNKSGKAQVPEARYYLLDFWNLGCAPCRADHQKMKNLKKSLKDKGIEVIGLSTDDNIIEWQKYLRNNEYDWTNYVVPEASTLLSDLRVYSYPEYYLIDKDYNFIGIFGGFEHFQHEFMNKLK